MVLMVIESNLARIMVLVGIMALLLLYCCQYYSAIVEKRPQFIGKLTINHLCMLFVLSGMFFSVIKNGLAIWMLSLGWLLFILSTAMNLRDKFRNHDKLQTGIQLRLLLLSLMSILLYLGI